LWELNAASTEFLKFARLMCALLWPGAEYLSAALGTVLGAMKVLTDDSRRNNA
jgi:hypothetical protein